MAGGKKVLPIYHASLITPLIIVFQSNYIVFAEIIAELDFDECERVVSRIAETMISFRWDVYVFAFLEL